jgi:hypothetical protein
LNLFSLLRGEVGWRVLQKVDEHDLLPEARRLEDLVREAIALLASELRDPSLGGVDRDAVVAALDRLHLGLSLPLARAA